MEHRDFHNGQRLRQVIMNNGFVVPNPDTDKDWQKVEAITIVMEAGQMAGVPWAEVKYKDGSTLKLNLAYAIGVSLWVKEVNDDQCS